MSIALIIGIGVVLLIVVIALKQRYGGAPRPDSTSGGYEAPGYVGDDAGGDDGGGGD